jgi:hypothetical protein
MQQMMGMAQGLMQQMAGKANSIVYHVTTISGPWDLSSG